MTRPYMTLANPPAALDIPTGGHLVVTGDDVRIPVMGAATATGGGFGPVHLGVPEESYVEVERVSFQPGDDPSSGLFSVVFPVGAAGAGAKAAHSHNEDLAADAEQPDVSRRAVLGAAVGLVTAGAISAGGLAQDELVTLRVAEVDVGTATAPLHVSILDLVDEVLPTSTELIVDVSGTRTGEIADPATGVTIGADRVTDATVEVYLRDSLGKVAQLLAWARGLLPGGSKVTYSRSFPDDTVASDYSEGEFVTLTEHPAILEPIEEGDPKEVELVIGSTVIPHESEGTNGAGAWSTFDGGIIYKAGSDPPASGDYTITVGLGFFDRHLN